ncbi:MAG TPA: hypothetical protein VMW25_04385 [Clostridia bacterium]|nr:hypothetical protein [Clostridia bacterium]
MKYKKLEVVLYENDIEKMKTEELAVAFFTFKKEDYYLIARVSLKELEVEEKVKKE